MMTATQRVGRRAALAGASLLAIGWTAPAAAQAQAAAAAQVGEVIVTAQKREERLLDVGLAISSLGADAADPTDRSHDGPGHPGSER